MDGTDVKGGHWPCTTPPTGLYWAASSSRQHGELDSAGQLPVWVWWDVNVKWGFGRVKNKTNQQQPKWQKLKNTKIRYLQYVGRRLVFCVYLPMMADNSLARGCKTIAEMEKIGLTYVGVLLSPNHFGCKQASGCLIWKKECKLIPFEEVTAFFACFGCLHEIYWLTVQCIV